MKCASAGARIERQSARGREMVDPTLVLAGIAATGGFLGGVGAFFNGLTAFRIAIRVTALSEHIADVKTDVAVVKKQGNHTQDLLVELTEKDAYARGKKDAAAAEEKGPL